MAEKRKMPARATRASASKKRNVTPKEATPVPTPPPVEKTPTPPPPPSLPTSLEAGEDLPAVDEAQPDDLSPEEYQSILESGVLAESLTRSRNKWVNEGLFEKYWTKPHKKKGVLLEDPKNPPKDSMMRVGNVTLNIEPHVVEAVMYVVRAPKPPPQTQPQPQPQQMQVQQGGPQQQQQQQQPMRPIIQYGPPGGSMPSPVARSNTASPSTPVGAVQQLQAHTGGQNSNVKPKPATPAGPGPTTTLNRPQPNTATPVSTQSQQTSRPPQAVAPAPHPASAPRPSAPQPQNTVNKPSPPAQQPPREGSKTPAAGDPVIALLAKRATSDEKLRDIMKRVAVGEATPDELAIFQKVIDQLNRETRATPPPPPQPSAKELYVDGKTVQYFAEEVRTILDIVLASNPNQKSSDLRPPPGSDPLVVLLVKTALEDARTRDIIRRIAEGRVRVGDVVGLKEILERLHRDTKIMPVQGQQHIQARGPPMMQQHPPPQKPPPKQKPPPAPKPDIEKVVFDFGSGDRYLFPKYSILEFQDSPGGGQQLLASFLIVRKGSDADSKGDPKLDFYQPVTIRLSTSQGRSLENIARVVAPYDEVVRYMDEVMDNMTRGEYLLLAMRLPRAVKDVEEGADGQQQQQKSRSSGTTPAPEGKVEEGEEEKRKGPDLLWTLPAGMKEGGKQAVPRVLSEEEERERRYQRLIASVAAKDVVSY